MDRPPAWPLLLVPTWAVLPVLLAWACLAAGSGGQLGGLGWAVAILDAISPVHGVRGVQALPMAAWVGLGAGGLGGAHLQGGGVGGRLGAWGWMGGWWWWWSMGRSRERAGMHRTGGTVPEGGGAVEAMAGVMKGDGHQKQCERAGWRRALRFPLPLVL